PKFEISVGEPSRVGGLDAHTSYRIRTKTTSPKFRNPEVSVNRRYRDFLWLFNQLSIGHPGVIIPPLPEKQTMGRFQEEFVESRRVGLERFLQKITSHPMLFDDADVKVFLESETFSADSSMLTKRDPSKATGGILGAFSMSNVTQFRATPDRDDFLDTRKMEIDKFEAQLKQLMKGVEAIVKQRKELGAATSEFGDALLALSGAESDQALSTKLKNLGNVSRRIKDLHDKQAQNDVSSLAYMVEEYIRFCGAVEMAYQSRTRYWNLVKNAEGNVMNKRLALDKARAAGKKGDKLTSIQTEIDEAEVALKQAQKEFAEVSAKLRQELERFDRERVVDLAKSLQEFLESLLFTQKEIVVTWESYYAETRQP
ncbi:Vps5 C terminal like-domain-containing protein, partial [Hyaloraphidium curvatum]